MPVIQHAISNVNGSQVFVRGLKLLALGYVPGAAVRVSDPSDRERKPWGFIVALREHASLVSPGSPPPSWLVAGVRVEIEITPPDGWTPTQAKSPRLRTANTVSVALTRQSPSGPIMRGAERPMFDRYVMIDWSSKASKGPRQPSKDSPWAGVGTWGEDGHLQEEQQYFRTRRSCIDWILRLLIDGGERRTLVGFDFAFGYPKGFAAALRLTGSPWEATWDAISGPPSDGAPTNNYATPTNENNRLEIARYLNRRVGCAGNAVAGPFWGCKLEHVTDELGRDRPSYAPMSGAEMGRPGSLPEWRTTEYLLRKAGRRPMSGKSSAIVMSVLLVASL